MMEQDRRMQHMRDAKKTILMCPPTYFDAMHLFNPWMTWREAVDTEKASAQWENLRQLIKQAGAAVQLIEPDPNASSMTFTRDAALVFQAGRALVLRNDGARGVTEPPLFRQWFESGGFVTEGLPPGYHLDGGNVLRRHDGSWLIGVKPGSDGRAERYLAKVLCRTTGATSVGIPLAARAYLHLDMVLADLNGHGWLLHERGLGLIDVEHPQWRAVFGDVPIICIGDDEASHLVCNVLVIDETIVTGFISRTVEQHVERLGFRVARTELGEFRKAGGGVHCLTLDVG